MSNNIKYKICKQCNESKVLGLFCINRGAKDGHNSVCLSCEKIKRDNKKNIIPGLSKPDRSRCNFVFSKRILLKKTTNVKD